MSGVLGGRDGVLLGEVEALTSPELPLSLHALPQQHSNTSLS